jgi:putative copper export protein
MLFQPPPPPEPGFTWAHAATELLGFLGSFALYGAVGFGNFVLPGAGPTPSVVRRATSVGIVGVLVTFLTQLIALARTATEKHLTLGAAFEAGGGALLARLAFLVLALVGLLLARRRGGHTAAARPGWALAALAALGLALRGIVTGRLTAVVNPLHVLAGGLWIGSLFVLAFSALPLTVSRWWPEGKHAAAVAVMVRRFSTLALASSALLVVTGVTTAWRHLHRLDALWTTPYGRTLCVKLVFVLAVAGLGAYNWRLVSPRLGHDDATETLVRSARTELGLALVVLVITAILVSIPAPKG